MFPLFIFRKSGLVKSRLSPEDLSECNTSWSYIDWRKFYIHSKSLNVRHFGMVAATALKLWLHGCLQWHDLPTDFHKNLLIDSEVDREYRHTGRMVISQPTFFPLGRKVD
jgi:hypothetical protein